MRAACRQLWLYSEPRKEALQRARYAPGWWVCAICRKPTSAKQVDHIVPVGRTPKIGDQAWGAWLARLFVKPEGLQVLCPPCHNRKTDKDLEGMGLNRSMFGD